MSHPLGSFPRFSHQQQWANERRARAITHSIATRKLQAEQSLRIEIAFCAELTRQATTMKAANGEGERLLAEFHHRLDASAARHAQGKRIYYKKLIDLLLLACECCDICPELQSKDESYLRSLIDAMADNYIAAHGGVWDL